MAGKNSKAPNEETRGLLVDLDELVARGLLEAVCRRGEPSRYALTAEGRAMVEQAAGVQEEPERSRDYVIVLEAEPCPACRSTDGYDGGGRCRGCHLYMPAEGC